MPTLPTGRALLDARDILSAAGLRFNMRYADFGCGTLGHFVVPASDMVGPNGHVYAVDILKDALSSVGSRIRLESIGNLETVWGDIERLGGVRITEHSLDLVSLVNICRLILKSPAVLDEIARVLKGDGRVLLVDWKKDRTPLGPAPEQRVTPEELQSVIKEKGFAPEKTFEAGKYHWGLLLRRAR